MTDTTIIGYKPLIYTEGYGIKIDGTEISVDNTEFASIPTGWADEKILKTTDTEGIFEFIDVPTGTLGGSTGSTDNAILRANGEGGVTLQSSLITIDDDGSINIPSGQSYKINGTALTASDVSAVANSLFDANTIIAANTDDTPAAVTIAENDLVGRLPSGNIAGITSADLTEEESPATGDFLLGWESSGAIRKFDIGELPGGSGDITSDDAWAAAGDLIVGTGENTASILTKGTTGYYLKAAADGLEWATVSTGGGAGGITWTEVTGTSGNAAADNGYICNNANLVTITLPSTIAVGKTIRIAGNGAGGWKLAQNASQVIYFGDQNTTTGTGGYLASVNRYDSIEIICITADTTFNVIGSMGDITVV